jgi:hypothetical protein
MFTNTGIVSFILYGFFIIITLIAMIVGIRLIKNGNIETSRLDKIIDLFKYSVVSVAIATVTLIISNLFKEREQDVKELEYFDKYVNDVKKADGIIERFQLSKYLSIVAPSGELKRSWNQYYDTIKVEYKEYTLLKNEKQKLDTTKKLTEKQIIRKQNIQEQISIKEAPLISYHISVTKDKNEVADMNAASSWEEKGFEYLLKKDVANAIFAFTVSENAYNRFHQVYEISKYLRDNRIKLDNPKSQFWKEAFEKIGREYSYQMPLAVKNRLIGASN